MEITKEENQHTCSCQKQDPNVRFNRKDGLTCQELAKVQIIKSVEYVAKNLAD